MKTIISILVGLIVFVLCFMGMGSLISWITSGIESHDFRVIMKIVLWIISVGGTIWLGIILGALAGGLVDTLWPTKKRR